MAAGDRLVLRVNEPGASGTTRELEGRETADGDFADAFTIYDAGGSPISTSNALAVKQGEAAAVTGVHTTNGDTTAISVSGYGSVVVQATGTAPTLTVFDGSADGGSTYPYTVLGIDLTTGRTLAGFSALSTYGINV